MTDWNNLTRSYNTLICDFFGISYFNLDRVQLDGICEKKNTRLDISTMPKSELLTSFSREFTFEIEDKLRLCCQSAVILYILDALFSNF